MKIPKKHGRGMRFPELSMLRRGDSLDFDADLAKNVRSAITYLQASVQKFYTTRLMENGQVLRVWRRSSKRKNVGGEK